jgi:predicted negative regulator of RcsB-dependent stress response
MKPVEFMIKYSTTFIVIGAIAAAGCIAWKAYTSSQRKEQLTLAVAELKKALNNKPQ